MKTQDAPAKFVSQIIQAVDDPAELEKLLEGMLTPQELDEVCVRWQLLTRLLAGQTQRDIAHELGISLGTIARGSRLLKYGSPGLAELVMRIEEKRRGN